MDVVHILNEIIGAMRRYYKCDMHLMPENVRKWHILDSFTFDSAQQHMVVESYPISDRTTAEATVKQLNDKAVLDVIEHALNEAKREVVNGQAQTGKGW